MYNIIYTYYIYYTVPGTRSGTVPVYNLNYQNYKIINLNLFFTWVAKSNSVLDLVLFLMDLQDTEFAC